LKILYKNIIFYNKKTPPRNWTGFTGRSKTALPETFEKYPILFKFKEGENMSADASLRVTGGIHRKLLMLNVEF